MMDTARPNVLWLVADHAIHANHGPAIERLPLQRALAKTGMLFHRAYTPLPICSPARASMLTGLYPHAHGLMENDGRFGGRPGLGAGDWMIQSAFRDAGYQCAWFGKWHLDNACGATEYGFDGFSLPGYGYPYSTEVYADYLKRSGLEAPVAEIEMPGESGVRAGTRISLSDAESWFDYEAGTAVIRGPEETHEAHFLADLAVNWLQGMGDGRFFLRLDPWGPHPPYMIPGAITDEAMPSDLFLSPNYESNLDGRPQHHRDYRDEWRDKLGLSDSGWRHMTHRAYQHAALVERAMCRVVDALSEAGLLDNTLIIYTADHGDAVGSNGGACNKGGLMVEETMRVPLVIGGPGITPGVTEGLVSTLDLVPTLVTRCTLGTDQPVHGHDLRDFLEGRTTSVRDGFMAQHNGLHVHLPQRAYYKGPWKYVVQSDGFEELYNLATDPAEMQNLTGDASSSAQLTVMRDDLSTQAVSVGDHFDLM